MAIPEKLTRLNEGHAPRVLDLFSGCGGISLGFQRAGCEIIGGVEFDPIAARSHATNFHAHLDEGLFAVHASARDITVTDPVELIAELGFAGEAPDNVVDLLVGGPPCPAFARVGRAKLREIHEHPEAFLQDPRAQLYLPYLDYVEALQPIALLMENVPDILNFGGHNLAEEICEVLEEWGYVCKYTLLNSANYGVPQMRERFFLVAVHEFAGQEFHFPLPTRYVVFPPGYEGSRQVALHNITQGNLFTENGHEPRFVPTPEAIVEQGPVTVEEAISDLPEIFGHLDGTIRRGARRFDGPPVGYREDVAPSFYAMEMRNWPGFEEDGQIVDHVIRSLSDRDYRLFRNMQPGDDYPAAHALAVQLFEQEVERLRDEGAELGDGSEEYLELKRKYVPPYDHGKFPNKWRKMEPDMPARTLMAHLGKDTYSHIHYDSNQARVISVREAARLQSFPDGFKFSGTMNPAYRQIGNAVPPLLAYRLAESILEVLPNNQEQVAQPDNLAV